MAANGDVRASREPASHKPDATSGLVRPAVATLLLIAAIAGVGATTAAPTSWHGRWHQDGDLIALALEALLLGLLAGLWLVKRRVRRPGHPAARLRMIVRRVILLVMLGVAVVVLLNFVAHTAGRNLLKTFRGHGQQALHGAKHPRPLARARPVHFDPALYLGALGALVLLAVIVAVVLVMVRRRRDGQAGYGFVGEYADNDDDSATLRDAVESGRSALRAVDDAQAAIIACYVAMESSLAEAGTARMAAETPDELLARAAGAGVLHGPAAGRLTELFYEARFSSHALPSAAKDEARRALDAISADLDRLAAGATT